MKQRASITVALATFGFSLTAFAAPNIGDKHIAGLGEKNCTDMVDNYNRFGLVDKEILDIALTEWALGYMTARNASIAKEASRADIEVLNSLDIAYSIRTKCATPKYAAGAVYVVVDDIFNKNLPGNS
jgi:hypothetical protein